MADSPDSRTERLVLLLTEHQQALFRYVFSLLANEADARDVLQETSLALVRKFDQYDSAKPFLPWAYRFAYLEVLKFRERSQRRPVLSEDVLELLNAERVRHESHLDARLAALDGCMRKLSEPDRQLVTFRYDQGRPVEEIMSHLALSRRTLFRSLERVRRLLHECVSRQLQTEGLL